MGLLSYAHHCPELDGQDQRLQCEDSSADLQFQIEVEFKIHGQGHLHGDGMAIWVIEERGKPGKVFGHTDNFNGLGVFIDTYKNSRPGVTFPYVMAMLGNSSVSYDKDHDGKDNELAGCSVRQPPHILALRVLMSCSRPAEFALPALSPRRLD